jgi:hypothetical protein
VQVLRLTKSTLGGLRLDHLRGFEDLVHDQLFHAMPSAWFLLWVSAEIRGRLSQAILASRLPSVSSQRSANGKPFNLLTSVLSTASNTSPTPEHLPFSFPKELALRWPLRPSFPAIHFLMSLSVTTRRTLAVCDAGSSEIYGDNKYS